MEKITDTVPKLKGESNFDNWRHDLQLFIDHKDLDLWPVLTGTVVAAIDAPLPTPSEREVRQTLADELGVSPANVTDAEIRVWIKENILNINEEYAWFRKANADCIHYLSASLKDSIKTFIRGQRNAAAAYRIICNTYGKVNAHTFQQRWSAWVTCTYKPSGQYGVFITKWKKALSELLECSPDRLSQQLQYAQFIEAIRAHPSTEHFVTSFKPDLSNPRLMDDVFSEFMSSELSRRHYTALASFSSTADRKDKDGKDDNKRRNNGTRGGGRQRGGRRSDNNNRNKDKGGEKKSADLWCDFHHRKGGHDSDNCFFNPKNKGKSRQQGGPSAASSSSQNSPMYEKGVDTPNASSARFDPDQYFLNASSAVISRF
jgi:hypothetical protein